MPVGAIFLQFHGPGPYAVDGRMAERRGSERNAAALISRRPPDELGARASRMQRALSKELSALAAGRQSAKRGARRILLDDREIRRTLRSEIGDLLDAVYEIEALVSMADVTEEKGYVFPSIEAGRGRIEAEGIVHPFLPAAVPNDLAVDPDRSVLFLTGPNMAGKTTYLKACAIALYLAHLGMGVPARSFRFTPFECLFSGLRTTDDLREGISYFLAEARRVKAAARHVRDGRSTFVLFDEMFRHRFRSTDDRFVRRAPPVCVWAGRRGRSALHVRTAARRPAWDGGELSRVFRR